MVLKPLQDSHFLISVTFIVHDWVFDDVPRDWALHRFCDKTHEVVRRCGALEFWRRNWSGKKGVKKKGFLDFITDDLIFFCVSLQLGLVSRSLCKTLMGKLLSITTAFTLAYASTVLTLTHASPVLTSLKWRDLHASQKHIYTYEHFVAEFDKSMANEADATRSRSNFEVIP